ncbi:MAG: hypothetical protein R6U39_05855 [Candidatus Aegiribacteria sp.]
MRAATAVLLLFLLVTAGCRTDYDIEEVASSEHLGEEHMHDEHDHMHEEHQQDEHEDEDAGLTGSDRHVHEAGVRNHGTEWFFNQPWAASFIWGKMLRDSLVLLALAAAIAFLSGRRSRQR